MIEAKQTRVDYFEEIPNPYQQVMYRINRMFGSELSDLTPLSFLTNYFRPQKGLDPLIARKYNRLWSSVFSGSNLKEKSMISRAFNALAKASLDTVGALRDVSETQVVYLAGIGNGSLDFLKACVEPKSEEEPS